MKFAAFVGTMDEIDLLPRTIENLRRIGVDEIVVIDSGSTDGTLEYVSEAERAGDIWLIHAEQDDEQRVGGRRAGIRNELACATDADWVLFVDSDEMWLPAGGSLRNLPELASADILFVDRYNVVLGPDGPALPGAVTTASYPDILVYAQPVTDVESRIQQDPETPWITGVLEPKVLVRRSAFVKAHSGTHGVDVTEDREWRWAVASDVLIAHVPIRTLERYERRAANIRKAIARRPDWYSSGRGWQWVRWAESLESGQTREEFERQRLDATELELLQARGVVRSVEQIFERLMPEVPSVEAYDVMVTRAQPWLAAVGVVGRREGIQPREKLIHASTGDFPTVLVRPDHVVKFFSSWRQGPEVLERQKAALRILDRLPSLPATRYVVDGALDDDWRYLVISLVRGAPLDELRSRLSADAMAEFAVWLGRTVRRMHAIELSKFERGTAWLSFGPILERRYAAVAGSIAAGGRLPPALAAQVESWLPSPEELLGSAEDMVFTHGNLSGAHIIGIHAPRKERFHPTGLVGFSRAGITHPLWDLGPIWWDVLRGDERMASAFLSKALLPGWGTPGFPRQALAWSLLNPGPAPAYGPVLEGITTLDELAERSFGQTASGAIAVGLMDRPAVD